jgi:hypothetical protein
MLALAYVVRLRLTKSPSVRVRCRSPDEKAWIADTSFVVDNGLDPRRRITYTRRRGD